MQERWIPQHTLTQHARERLKQRSCMRATDLLAMMDGKRYLEYSSQAPLRRSMRLIYSPDDQDWFVIPVGYDRKEIISVWTLEYAGNLVKAPSEEDKESVRKDMFDWVPRKNRFGSGMYALGYRERYKVWVRTYDGVDLRHRVIGNFPIVEVGEPEDILGHAPFHAKLQRWLDRKGIPIQDVVAVSLRNNINGEIHFLKL